LIIFPVNASSINQMCNLYINTHGFGTSMEATLVRETRALQDEILHHDSKCSTNAGARDVYHPQFAKNENLRIVDPSWFPWQ